MTQIAFLLYDDMTALDAVGPYEVLARLPGAEVRFVAARPGPIQTDVGMILVADGLHQHIPRGYVYFAMGFSILVEMLNLKAQSKRAQKQAGGH